MVSRQPISTLFPYTTLFRSMGFVACLFSLFLMGGLALAGREHSWKTWAAALALIGLLIGSGFVFLAPDQLIRDRKSTRLNSSHRTISYAVFCLKKQKV